MSDLREILNELVTLLESAGDREWASGMREFESRLVRDPEEEAAIARELLRIFGGMGSFNDLILQREGEMLPEENERMRQLRRRLRREWLRIL